MGFSRQEYWSGLPFPSPGDLPDPGFEPRSPVLQADSLPSEPPGKLDQIKEYPQKGKMSLKWRPNDLFGNEDSKEETRGKITWRYRTQILNRSIDGLPKWLSGKESACSAGDVSSVSGLGRSPGEGNDNPFQYSCLRNPMYRGAWWATVCGVAEVVGTRLSN